MQDPKPVIFDEMTHAEVSALIERGMTMAIMPTGATEQHGLHLPLLVDYFLAHRIALGVSTNTGIPVFPPLPFGHSGNHSGFPATLSLRPETFQQVAEEICEWAYDTGFRKLLFLSGNLPNVPPLQSAIVNVLRRTPDMQIRAMNWWDITPELQAMFYGDESYGRCHGNIVETAIMRYFRDDLVKMDKSYAHPGKGVRLFFHYMHKDVSRDGHQGDPTGATPELGERIYRMAVDGLSEQVKRALVETKPDLYADGA